MADIDTSSYPKFQQTSPLDTVGKVMKLQNTLNQNRLFQQQFNTNLAASEGMKAAIDPNTGEYDPQKLRAWIASNPNAGYGLGQIIQQSQEAQGRNIENKNKQYDYQQKQLKTLAGYTAKLMKPGSTGEDAIGVFAEALVNGAIDSQQFMKAQRELPRIPGTDKIDNSRIPEWAEAETTKFMAEHDRLNYYNPQPQQVNTPQGTRFERVPQAMGATPTDAGGFIPAVPGPTEKKFNPATQREEFVGVLPNGGMGGAPQAQGAAPGGVMGGQPPAQAAPNAFAPGTPAGPALGEAEAAQTTQHGGAEQGLALQRRASLVPETKAILGNLLAELNTPGFTVGPGTKGVADAAKFMNAQLGTNIRIEGTAAREQFEKLAGMYAQSQFQQLGGTGANAQLDATTLTSPNSKLSALGNRGIIAMLNGNEDAIKAKNEAWQQWSAQHGSGTFGQFVTDFQKHFDPRVFQSQYLGDADKKKMISGMSQKEKNDLHSAFVFAKQNGWIQ